MYNWMYFFVYRMGLWLGVGGGEANKWQFTVHLHFQQVCYGSNCKSPGKPFQLKMNEINK